MWGEFQRFLRSSESLGTESWVRGKAWGSPYTFVDLRRQILTSIFSREAPIEAELRAPPVTGWTLQLCLGWAEKPLWYHRGSKLMSSSWHEAQLGRGHAYQTAVRLQKDLRRGEKQPICSFPDGKQSESSFYFYAWLMEEL